MGHLRVKRSTRHYMSVGGTFAVMGVCFFIGFVIGLAVGSGL